MFLKIIDITVNAHTIMRTKLIITIFFALLSVSFASAQLGIRAGVNMANEIQSFDHEGISAAFQSENLTGYQVGLVYQLNPRNYGLGFEVGALLSQKGGVFSIDSTGVVNSFVKGYREINYVEVPMNLRLKLNFGGVVGVFGTAGVYGAYALKGKTVFESDLPTLIKEDSFESFMDRIDYGYSYGAGVELVRKLQIGAHWSQGLQKRDTNKNILDVIQTESGGIAPNLKATSMLKSFSVTLTYMF